MASCETAPSGGLPVPIHTIRSTEGIAPSSFSRRTAGANISSQNSVRDSLSLTQYAISAGARRVLTGTKTPPAQAVP